MASTRSAGPFVNELMPADFFLRLEVEAIFGGRPGEIEVDLGCGDGGFLLAMAEHHAERNFLGVERLLGRVRKVCREVEKRNLENVRALRLETNYAVEWLLPRGMARRVHLLCPDPWPKKKHHRHRLMARPEFLRSIHGLLEEGGEFLFKTDHPGYFEHALETLQEVSFFERVDWPEDAFFYPTTDFERQWLAEGRTIQRLRLRRLASTSSLRPDDLQ